MAEFDLVPTSPRQFTGSFGLGDTITDGHVSGPNIVFTRHWQGLLTQTWRGRLSPGRMAGSITGNESCRWEASKI